MYQICEVQSDKATVDISSKFDGVITSVHYETGDMAIVGEPLVTIEVEGDGTEAEEEVAAPAAVASPAAAESSAVASEPVDGSYLCGQGKALATPAVRRVARDHKIDIGTISGTGKDGRVLKEDVLRAAGAISPAAPTAPATPKTEGSASTTAVTTFTPSGTAQDETIPLRGAS